MTDNLILKNIIAAKRNNPYTENKTIDQLRKETGTAGALIPLPHNIYKPPTFAFVGGFLVLIIHYHEMQSRGSGAVHSN